MACSQEGNMPRHPPFISDLPWTRVWFKPSLTASCPFPCPEVGRVPWDVLNTKQMKTTHQVTIFAKAIGLSFVLIVTVPQGRPGVLAQGSPSMEGKWLSF